jgi:hypothetical protein
MMMNIHIKLNVKKVMSIGKNTIRLILIRPGLRSRVEPIPRTQEQKIAQDITKQAEQALGSMFPEGIVIGGPRGTQFDKDLTVDMQITEDEYAQMGKPGINEIVKLDINKIEEENHSKRR